MFSTIPSKMMIIAGVFVAKVVNPSPSPTFKWEFTSKSKEYSNFRPLGKTSDSRLFLRRMEDGRLGGKRRGRMRTCPMVALFGTILASNPQQIHAQVDTKHSHGSRRMSGEDDYDDEVDTELVATAVAAIVLVLIFLTIVFEKTKHYIEHSADKAMQPIIQSLFGQMTVLGFLNIFTVCITELGFFEQLSIDLFGEKEALIEEFEFVHYLLFGVMVFFMLMALLMLQEGKTMEKDLFVMDRSCLDRTYIETLQEKYFNEFGATCRLPSYFWYLAESFFPWRSSCISKRRRESLIREQLLFDRLRTEFLLERSPSPPFSPSIFRDTPHDFNYGRYLSLCLGQTLGSVVEVDVPTWTFFAVLTIIIYGILKLIRHDFEVFGWIWMSLAWFTFISIKSLDYHFEWILQSMAAPEPLSSKYLDSHRTVLDGKDSPLLDTKNMDISDNEARSSLAGDCKLPAWCYIDLDQYIGRRSTLLRWFASNHPPTRQDSLYLAEHNGSQVFRTFFQIRMIFSAAYLALLALAFYPWFWRNTSALTFQSYLILSICPVLLVRMQGKASAFLLAHVTSIGVHRKASIVAQVVREEKTARVVRAFCILQRLQHAANQGVFCAAKDGPSSSMVDSPSSGDPPVDPLELLEVARTFDAMDSSGRGKIETERLGDVLKQLGVALSPETLSQMVAVLDVDGDGFVSRQEFLDFYRRHVATTLKKTSVDEIRHRAQYFFELFDIDGSGEISIQEFKTTLDAFHVGFSVDEISELVRELDVHSTGNISSKEFLALFERHEALAQQQRSRRLA